MSYFTRDEILMGREIGSPISQEQSDNLDRLIEALEPVREAYGRALFVSSGYRPSSINLAVGGAKFSAHMDCQAVDIKDEDGYFASWIINNLDILRDSGILGFEDPRYTMIINSKGERVSGWVHLDIRGVRSGTLVFIPYGGPIKLKMRD